MEQEGTKTTQPQTLRERYESAVLEARKDFEAAKTALEMAEAKLHAFDLLAEDLPSGSFINGPRTLTEAEVEEFARGMEGLFTYKDLIHVAFKKYGTFIEAASVRTSLTKIAARPDSPIEVAFPGVGRAPSKFRKKREEVPQA